MNTNEDYVEEFIAIFMGTCGIGMKEGLNTWFRTTLEEVRREERERLLASIDTVKIGDTTICHPDDLRKALTPTRTDKATGTDEKQGLELYTDEYPPEL